MQEKGTRDNAANESYGNSISMVLGCGHTNNFLPISSPIAKNLAYRYTGA
jgi:hypothetical protein